MKDCFIIAVTVFIVLSSLLSTALAKSEYVPERFKDVKGVGGLVEETGESIDEGDFKNSIYGVFVLIIIVTVFFLCIKWGKELLFGK